MPSVLKGIRQNSISYLNTLSNLLSFALQILKFTLQSSLLFYNKSKRKRRSIKLIYNLKGSMKIYLIGVLQISNLWKATHVFRQDKLYIIGVLIINLTFQLRNPTGSLWNKVTVRHEVLFFFFFFKVLLDFIYLFIYLFIFGCVGS